MGARGVPPVPTAILRARGSWRAKINRKEPTGHGTPRCPAWLDSDAKAAWKALIPMLKRLGVLATADAFAIARYCDMLVEYKRLAVHVAECGSVSADRISAEAKHKGELADKLLRLEQNFGLTPSARSRIQVSKKDSPKEQDISRFFKPRVMG